MRIRCRIIFVNIRSEKKYTFYTKAMRQKILLAKFEDLTCTRIAPFNDLLFSIHLSVKINYFSSRRLKFPAKNYRQMYTDKCIVNQNNDQASSITDTALKICSNNPLPCETP